MLVYDDVCHLASFAKNHVRLQTNETTEYFSSLKFAIDKFHFKNHIDEFCHKNYNPRNVKELENVNTVICEHLFKDINQYKNCKSMNEAHFFIYFFYNLDLHNLKREGLACMVNPDSEFRKNEIQETKLENIDFDLLKKANETDLSDVTYQLECLSVDMPFNCPKCSSGFKTEPSLSKHINLKHPELNPENPKACPSCDRILSSEQRLKTHMKTHRVCKICKMEFKSELEMMTHKKGHTTCKQCKKDFLTESKLKRHGDCTQ